MEPYENVLALLTMFPCSFGDPKVNMDFLVMQELPFDTIIGCSTTEELGTCVNLGNQSVSFQVGGLTVNTLLEFDKGLIPE